MKLHQRFRGLFRCCAAVVGVTVFWATIAAAGTFYVRPGSADGDGSAERPWPDLETAIRTGGLHGGDVIRLFSGDYGEVVISGIHDSNTIRIVAEENEVPHFEAIRIRDSRNLALEGLSVWPTDPSARQAPLVHVERSAERVTLERLDVRGARDASGYKSWSKSRWKGILSGGILIEGDNARIIDSTITAISGGMGIIGDDALVRGNIISGFSQDGVQAVGDGLMFRNNLVQDCVAIDQNHDDGFQSWSSGPSGPGSGTLVGLTIDSNYILEWTGPPEHPLSCSLQGVGMFDGMYKDLVISNNVIAVSSYHGIGISGAVDAIIAHNTVISVLGPRRDSPWIEVSYHKDGRPSRNVLLANNLAPIVRMDPKFGRIVGNANIVYPARELVEPYSGDFSPKPGSALIDSGVALPSIPNDIRGFPRFVGKAPDIGAIEVQ